MQGSTQNTPGEARSAKNQRDTRERVAPPAFDVAWLLLYLLIIGVCAVTMALSPELRGYAFLGLIVTVGLMPIGLGASARQATSDHQDLLTPQFERFAAAMESMSRDAGLSDAAKSVLHRRQERELLRREIEHDIEDEDWDAAMILVKELAERFGYRVDAEEYRSRIEHARAETLDRNVTGAISTLDMLLRERRWTDAHAESSRISRLYPESHRVDGLQERVEEARQRYKVELERRFLHAAEREEIDQAMAFLKELDSYLSENEAGPLREVARGVIGKARDNLGVRFKLLLQDRNWGDALDTGERIISEFPNTRMAEEVRNMLDTLREKTSEMTRSRSARVT